MRRLKSATLTMVVFAGTTFVAVILSDEFASANVSMLNDGAGKEVGAILIHSEIKKGDLLAFTNAADRIKQITRYSTNGVPLITVELDTSGGDVMEAIQIGRLVHERFMVTIVKPKRECASACVFILIAGAVHTPTDEARVGLHRPRFDPSYFANLTPEQARNKYNLLVENLHNYFVEMSGSEDAFRLMLSTPSDRIRYLSAAELDKFGLRGEDPAWEELSNAKMVERYGSIRWPLIKQCTSISGDLAGCEKKAYERYPGK